MSNTPYDDVFRTLLNDCSSLIIPVINEIFGEHYTGNEQVVFAPNEHFMNQQDGKEDKRITDTSFKIIGATQKKYHSECQSTSDNTMLIRFFEYDSQIALDEGEIVGNILTVTFPHSSVIYLRHNENTPEHLKVKMVTPGGELTYEIPVMKAQLYTIEEIFKKKLLFLIPFYIFSHEKRFDEYESDDNNLNILKAEYEEIKSKLEELLISGQITEYTKCTIVDMSNKVLENIAQKHIKIQEGVKSVMGGKVLDYEAKEILNQGKREGRQEGVQEGRQERNREIADKMIKRGEMSFEDISDYSGLSVEEVRELAEKQGRLTPV